MEFLQTADGKLCRGREPFLLRGMGLGGWLLPEGYMWKLDNGCDRPRRMEALIRDLCGDAYAGRFWQRYCGSYITERDIAWIAGQGLNSVRLPLNARHLFRTEENGAVRFIPETLRHVDDCVAWCRKYGLYVFLDMHAAPGGQTGQNIDDSEADVPALFLSQAHQDALTRMWTLLARRYAGEPAVGGYDLLNEPLPEWQRALYPRLLPLYRRLIRGIRREDRRHLVVLEGVHWATDMSVLDAFAPEEAQAQILLEFHKYWNNPDEESLSAFLETARRLGAPLWMGEGGENNAAWYTHAFPLYERCGIGWCFWSYKKMETPNSPVTFPRPAGWERILAFTAGGERPGQAEAQEIFEAFLGCVARPDYHEEVINALLRRPPLTVPAAAYDWEDMTETREKTVAFRRNSRAALRFADGHSGSPDWRRYGGEPQPEAQRLQLCLREGDRAGYALRTGNDERLLVRVQAEGDGSLRVQGCPAAPGCWVRVPVSAGELLVLSCAKGEVFVETLEIRREESRADGLF